MNNLKNFINKQINVINLQVFSGKILRSILAFIITYILIKLCNYIIKRTFSLEGRSRIRDRERLRTLEAILRSTINYGLIIILILYTLSLWFGALGITLAGIGGIALGFGAQSFIKDLLAGIFILLEDKYKIGDFVTLNNKSGFVIDIGIRTTKLKDLNGEIHMIPNGSVDVVSNGSIDKRRFLVDFSLRADEPIDKVKEVIESCCNDFKRKYKEVIDGPNYIGIVKLEANTAVHRVQGTSDFKNYWSLENSLREEILRYFTKAGINLTLTCLDFVKGSNND